MFTASLFLSNKHTQFCLKTNIYFVVCIELYVCFVIVQITIKSWGTVTTECSKLNVYFYLPISLSVCDRLERARANWAPIFPISVGAPRSCIILISSLSNGEWIKDATLQSLENIQCLLRSGDLLAVNVLTTWQHDQSLRSLLLLLSKPTGADHWEVDWWFPVRNKWHDCLHYWLL